MAMYIERVPNRNSPPAVLLRESKRENGKVKKRTVANLTGLPDHVIEGFKAVLKGATVSSDHGVDAKAGLVLEGGQQHGCVAAIWNVIKELGLDKMIASRPSRARSLVLAMIMDRLLHGDSKLATARHCRPETAATSLGWMLGVEDATEKECYEAMDWLLERKEGIEKKLAQKHIQTDAPLLFDLSSSYFEGRSCPLARHGYSRDHRSDLPQVNYGLYCCEDGTPIAVDVLPGNEGDRVAFPQAIKRARKDFHKHHVIFVGDRGMISGKAIDEHLRDLEGSEWITALTHSSIRKLEQQGAIQLDLFDEHNLMTVTHPDYPDERLIVCRNQALAHERKRKRQALLEATESLLTHVQAKTHRKTKPLTGKDAIGIEVGKVINRKKVAKHFNCTITETTFTFERNEEKIKQEAALDGLYVIRTSIEEKKMTSADIVRHYKNLAMVERAFRSLKSIDIGVRPIYHRRSDRVTSHIFICMLAYYVEKAMRDKLTPILFSDEDKPKRSGDDIVKPAQRSQEAKEKDAKRQTEDDRPVSSFRDVLNTLGGVVRARATLKGYATQSFITVSQPNEHQRHILKLLGVKKLM